MDSRFISYPRSLPRRRAVGTAVFLLAALVWALNGCSNSPTTSGASPSATPSISTSAASSPASAAPSSTGSASASGMAISRSQAKRIAVAAVGGGTVTEAKTDHKGGVLVWEIDVTRNGVKHEVDVNAATGKVMSKHVD
jgi:hypothetical protein